MKEYKPKEKDTKVNSFVGGEYMPTKEIKALIQLPESEKKKLVVGDEAIDEKEINQLIKNIFENYAAA